MEEGRKGSMCNKVTKGAPCKGKGIGRRKKVEEDREKKQHAWPSYKKHSKR